MNAKLTTALLLGLLLSSTGCFSSNRGGSLRQAMNKASDDNQGDRQVTGRTEAPPSYDRDDECRRHPSKNRRNRRDDSPHPRHCPEPEEDDGPSLLGLLLDTPNASDNNWTRATDEGNTNSYFGIRIISGLKYSSHYSGIAGGSLVFARHIEKQKRKAFYFGGASIPTDETSDLFGSVDGIGEIHAGYQFRGYSTPDHTWMGLFAHVGCELKTLFWNYNNPVYADVTNDWGELVEQETITSDGVLGLNGNVGLGWSFLQTRNAKFSVEASAHFNAYWVNTFNGFNNDLFSPDMELRLTLEAVFGGKQ